MLLKVREEIHSKHVLKNLISGLKAGGNTIENELFFDTLKFKPQMSLNEIKQRSKEKRINLRYYEDGGVSGLGSP